MSDLILYINGFQVPAGDVTQWPVLNESISYDSSFNIPDSYSFQLNNTNPNKYDPKYSGSIFNGTQVLKLPVTVFDPDINRTVMRGVIKNISTDSATGKLTIDCTSQLSALSTNSVQIVKTNTTPADIVYGMLTAPITLGSTTPLIDPSYIDSSSYKYAANYQASNKCYCNISVYKGTESDKKYADIIPELNKLGHMLVYSHYDKIYFWQYTSAKTPSIIISSYVAGSYKDYYSTDEQYIVRNSCYVAYYNGTSIAYYTNKDLPSITKYGEQTFGIPSDDVNSNATADFSALISNHTGAKWCGDTGTSRLKAPAFMCEFALSYDYSFLQVGDIIGLNFDAFSGLNTPVRILSADYDRINYRIRFSAIFL